MSVVRTLIPSMLAMVQTGTNWSLSIWDIRYRSLDRFSLQCTHNHRKSERKPSNSNICLVTHAWNTPPTIVILCELNLQFGFIPEVFPNGNPFVPISVLSGMLTHMWIYHATVKWVVITINLQDGRHRLNYMEWTKIGRQATSTLHWEEFQSLGNKGSISTLILNRLADTHLEK